MVRLLNGCVALPCVLVACASAPQPASQVRGPDPMPPAWVQLESASTGEPALEPSRISQVDLERARTLLNEARNELEPGQWKLLENRLAEAERAWAHFNAVAQEGGSVAEVARGTEGFAEAGRVSKTEGLRANPRLGPLLFLLLLLWPSETADATHDHSPPWYVAEREFKERLRELAQAAQEVSSEIEAARKRAARSAPEKGRTSQPAPQAGGGQPPGDDPPCIHIETRKGGPFEGGAGGPIFCRYACGETQVEIETWGNSVDACNRPINFERAARKAALKRARNEQGR